MLKLLLLFIGVPWLEIELFVRVGGELGALPTLGLVILTGVVGASLARAQGIALLARLQSETAAGRVPAEALVEGAAILVAGLLLVTPGFFTDACGLLLLVPPVRRAVVGAVRRRMERAVRQGHVRLHVGGLGNFGGPGGSPFGGGPGGPMGDGGVRDAEVVDVSGPDDSDDGDAPRPRDGSRALSE